MTYTYTFNNFPIKHDGTDYLLYAKVQYTIEKDDGGDEAVFESATIEEAMGRTGIIRDRKTLDTFELPLLTALNNDSFTARTVALHTKRA